MLMDNLEMEAKSLNERLDYYGLRIRNRSNAVFLELSDPNTFRIRELNISSNKALMTILNKEVSGELVFFGDDALEQVSLAVLVVLKSF